MLRLIARDFLKWSSSVRSISCMPISMNRDVRIPPNEFFASENQSFVVKQIHSADSSIDLLNMFSKTLKEDIEPQHLTLALDRLFTLHKNDNHSVRPSQLTNHEGFSKICQLLKFNGPHMEANDLVNCLKVLSYFGLNSDNLTVQRILHLVKDQINNFMPNSLTFLSVLLTKMKPTPLTEALLIAIPVVFDFNLSQRIDHNNIVELTELLHFLTRSSMKISNQSMTTIFSALLLNSDSLTVQQAKSIVWSLTTMYKFDSAFEKLYNNCVDILNENINDLPFTDVEATLQKMIEKNQEGESEFLVGSFLESTVNYVVDKDVGFLQALYILKKFNKIHFVSYQMLDYIDSKVVENHSSLSSCRFTALVTFAEGFSNAGYKSENWKTITEVLLENPLIRSDDLKIPWLSLAYVFMSLDFHSKVLMEKAFSVRYLENLLKRRDLLDQVRLLWLWQSVKLLLPDYDGPLPEQRFIDNAIAVNFKTPKENFVKALSDVFGGSEFVQTNVESSYGHCLDHVISFDSNEKPIAMPCKIKSYDQLPKSQVKSIAVFFNSRAYYPVNLPDRLRGIFELRRRTLEVLGIKTAEISLPIWNNLPEEEKLDYLDREIRYALK